MTRRFQVAALSLGLLFGAAAADATPITVDFSVTSNDVSNPSYGSGVVGTGYFTFDDSLIPASGTAHLGNPIVPLPTLDFFFDWFGVSFDESNAQIAVLDFTDGALSNWMVGGSFRPASCGFLTYACTSSGGGAPDFDGIGSGGIAFTDGKRPGLAYGLVTWSVRDTAVAEPGTLALFGIAIGALAFVRRRRTGLTDLPSQRYLELPAPTQ
jgi:hypothetical protein